MKLTAFVIFFFLFLSLSAQIKIGPAYSIITKGKEFRNGSYYLPDFSNPDSIFIKENSTGHVCQLTWCRWTFIIQSQVFKVKDMEEICNYLHRLKPRDKIIMEKIVLLPDCFTPPEQINIGVN